MEIPVHEIAGGLDAEIAALVTMTESAIQSMGAVHALQVIRDYRLVLNVFSFSKTIF